MMTKSYVTTALSLLISSYFGLGCGCEVDGGTVNRNVVKGVQRSVGFYYNIRPDCTSPGPVSLNLVTRPEHGDFSSAEASDLISNSPYPKCNGKSTQGTLVNYQSNLGYTGSDSFTVEATFANGKKKQTKFNVTVRTDLQAR